MLLAARQRAPRVRLPAPRSRPAPKPTLEIGKLPKTNKGILSLLKEHVARSIAAKPPVALPARPSSSSSSSSSSTPGRPVRRVDHSPFVPVNMYRDTSGNLRQSQKTFLNRSDRIIPPGGSLRPIPHVRGKAEDKEKSGLTSFSETVQERYAPRGRSSFMLTAQATPHNSHTNPEVQKRIARSKHPALKAEVSDAEKAEAGVPLDQPLTLGGKLAIWNKRDTESLMFPREQISAIHRLVPRRTEKPAPEILKRHGLAHDASWIDVDEARAKKQRKPFAREGALESHRKITISPKMRATVQRVLQRQHELMLARELRKVKTAHAAGVLSTKDAQKQLNDLVRPHVKGARRVAAEDRAEL